MKTILKIKQLKDKIKNITKGQQEEFHNYLRMFFMERILERISVSNYRENIILKGGILIVSKVGIHSRATRDIDGSLNNISFKNFEIRKIIEDIINIEIEDNVKIKIISIRKNMLMEKYSGYEVKLEVNLEKTKQIIKLDLSTNDIITPEAIKYGYRLTLEKREINLFTYNIETIISEKICAILRWADQTSRLKDYYDLFLIKQLEEHSLNITKQALLNTISIKGEEEWIFIYKEILEKIKKSDAMKERWEKYKNTFSFVETTLTWDFIFESVQKLIMEVIEFDEK